MLPRRRAADQRRVAPMSVANGREFLAIPGPTNIPDAVLAAMHRPATDIYSGDMLSITRTLLEDLPKIFKTTGKTYIYAANGHGGWEAAISNVLSRGETILVLESGLFAVGWGEMARIMGVKIEVLKGDWRRAVDPAAVTQRLKADAGHEIKASSPCRSTRPPASSTTSRRSARPSTPPAIPRCSWWTAWPRSAACRSTWTAGASTWPWPARRRAS